MPPSPAPLLGPVTITDDKATATCPAVSRNAAATSPSAGSTVTADVPYTDLPDPKSRPDMVERFESVVIAARTRMWRRVMPGEAQEGVARRAGETKAKRRVLPDPPACWD